MNKKLLFAILLVVFRLLPMKNRTSQTYLFTRPAIHNITAKQALWHDMAYKNSDLDYNFQIVPIYQKSIKNKCSKKSRHISEYFLLDYQSTIVVAGDNYKPNERNVRAEWLGLDKDFQGIFNLLPEQSQAGFFLDAKVDLKHLVPDTFFESCYVGATISAFTVKNHLNMDEKILNGKGSIIEQLQRKNLKFGKFLQESKSSGLSDLKLLIGTEYNIESGFEATYDFYILFPLAKKQNGRQLFQATRSFNGHLGYGNAINLQFPLTEKCSEYLVAFYFEAENIYLFENHQYRSFDLYFKQWSRFLLLNKIDGTTNIPAINVLTQKVKVKPYNVVDLSAGFRYKKNCLEVEVGYALWAHGGEGIEFDDKNCFGKVYGIAAKPGEFTPNGIPATASTSTIDFQGPTDKDQFGNNIFVPIERRDLNLCSASSRSTLVHRAHFAIGNVSKDCDYNKLIAFGFFYEIPQNNAALQQWGIWGKVGASF